MAHNHGSEYQVRIVRGDGTEELSGWLKSAEQASQAIAACHRPQDKAYWLLERNVLCPTAQIRERESWNIPLRISLLHDVTHTTPVIWWKLGRRAGTSLG